MEWGFSFTLNGLQPHCALYDMMLLATPLRLILLQNHLSSCHKSVKGRSKDL